MNDSYGELVKVNIFTQGTSADVNSVQQEHGGKVTVLHGTSFQFEMLNGLPSFLDPDVSYYVSFA